MDKNKYAIVSNKIIHGNETVNWLYREEADKESDSGWRIFHGDEDENYMSNYENFTICSLEFVLEKHNYIEHLLDKPMGLSAMN